MKVFATLPGAAGACGLYQCFAYPRDMELGKDTFHCPNCGGRVDLSNLSCIPNPRFCPHCDDMDYRTVWVKKRNEHDVLELEFCLVKF